MVRADAVTPIRLAQLHMFDYEKQENPELTDDTTVFAAAFNGTSNTFATAAGRHVKVSACCCVR